MEGGGTVQAATKFNVISRIQVMQRKPKPRVSGREASPGLATTTNQVRLLVYIDVHRKELRHPPLATTAGPINPLLSRVAPCEHALPTARWQCGRFRTKKRSSGPTGSAFLWEHPVLLVYLWNFDLVRSPGAFGWDSRWLVELTNNRCCRVGHVGRQIFQSGDAQPQAGAIRVVVRTVD